VHGNVYKVPDISEDKLNDLADKFLIDTEMQDISPGQQAQARNLTASIFVVQQAEVNVTIEFVAGANGDVGTEKGAVNAVSNRIVYLKDVSGEILTGLGWRGSGDSGSG
jgi:hypothetical protein